MEEVSLARLREDTLAVARGMSAMGIGVGDAVAIDMPMTYRSVPLYLGIVAIGAVVVSIADSFAPAEIALARSMPRRFEPRDWSSPTTSPPWRMRTSTSSRSRRR